MKDKKQTLEERYTEYCKNNKPNKGESFSHFLNWMKTENSEIQIERMLENIVLVKAMPLLF